MFGQFVEEIMLMDPMIPRERVAEAKSHSHASGKVRRGDYEETALQRPCVFEEITFYDDGMTACK